MAFAMAACWDEACEGHARAHGRPGVAALAAIWPWVHQLNWGQLLNAFVLGYEVGARMGALLRIAPGMHVDGNWPSLGGAAAAASAFARAADGGCVLPAPGSLHGVIPAREMAPALEALRGLARFSPTADGPPVSLAD
jgi:hypothetical protein